MVFFNTPTSMESILLLEHVIIRLPVAGMQDELLQQGCHTVLQLYSSCKEPMYVSSTCDVTLQSFVCTCYEAVYRPAANARHGTAAAAAPAASIAAVSSIYHHCGSPLQARPCDKCQGSTAHTKSTTPSSQLSTTSKAAHLHHNSCSTTGLPAAQQLQSQQHTSQNTTPPFSF
jgi:hypothetical protein